MTENENIMPGGEFILYTTEDGKSRVECRFENETLWLSQALMAELFGRSTKTINEHLKNLYAEEELTAEATIRKFRIVRIEGSRYGAVVHNFRTTDSDHKTISLKTAA